MVRKPSLFLVEVLHGARFEFPSRISTPPVAGSCVEALALSRFPCVSLLSREALQCVTSAWCRLLLRYPSTPCRRTQAGRLVCIGLQEYHPRTCRKKALYTAGQPSPLSFRRRRRKKKAKRESVRMRGRARLIYLRHRYPKESTSAL